VNLVSSYYHQDGERSAVTGGFGTEQLSDYANSIEVKLKKYDKKYRKHTLDLELGVDVYTSASSDQIDLKANSSASSADMRVYPSVNWTVENEQKGHSFGLSASLSKEFDYFSTGFGAQYGKQSKDRNREFNVSGHVYLDQVKLVYPVELRTFTGGGREHDYNSSSRNSYSGSLSLSQVINKKLQMMFLLDLVYQEGYLGLPFHRVYLNTNAVQVERLPSSRFKIPLGVRANYFLGDKVVLRSFYRFYHDDWGLNAHTAELETAIKLNAFYSVTPFYRYYTQTAVNYFAGYGEHTASDQYATSNYDLSNFSSHFVGAGFRMAPPKGVLGIQQWKMLELRYGHYISNRTLQSDVITLQLKF